MTHVFGTLLAIGLLTAIAMGPWVTRAASVTARIDRPAILIASPAPDCRPGGNRQLVVSVIAYEAPDKAGAVLFVVSARTSSAGMERELGRFSIFPDVDFKATAPDQAMHFGFPLPPDLATCQHIEVKVRIDAQPGTGKRGSIMISTAEIR